MANISRFFVTSSTSRGKSKLLEFYVTYPRLSEQIGNNQTKIKKFEKSSNKMKLIYTYGALSIYDVTIIWSPDEAKFAVSCQLSSKLHVIVCNFDNAEELLDVDGKFDSWSDDSTSVVVKDAQGTHVHRVEPEIGYYGDWRDDLYGRDYYGYDDGRRTSAGIPSIAEPFIPPPGYPGWK